jgi:type II restriction/modification system DNA methylase subunit YeeA
MSEIIEKIKEFIEYKKLLKGDEKGEAQVFCDRLFIAFGHKGYKEAGATLEMRIKSKSNKGTSFADLVWPGRVLIEMKKSGTKLQHHYQQAFEYWIAFVPNRPRYVLLCNFDEFWIYDFDKQIGTPIDKVSCSDLPRRYTTLNFLFPHNPDPIFENDLVEVTREAADKVAQIFKKLIDRGENRETAQRFVLQCVISMFAEDIDLLPNGLFYQMAHDCLHKGENSYDLFGGLFNQMNNPQKAGGGRFKDVRYFNGGIFSKVGPIELTREELELLLKAAKEDWSKVNPAIFGTIFQDSMDAEERHAFGSHFTSEADILRIVNPTIVYPWRERIDKAKTLKELIKIRNEITQFKILDPACGSGNFLYVSYRELVKLEIRLLTKIKVDYSLKEFKKYFRDSSLISPHQFYGIERDSFGVELAKISLMLAKKLAIDEVLEAMEEQQIPLGLTEDQALPLDNLDNFFQAKDALFISWPKVDVIIGNPPYQSKNKIQQELGLAYINEVRDKFPDVPGLADYCVYWFRKAHDELKKGQRAGLVGTNTIRQNYSRKGGLDYIVNNNGTILESVSSQVWSGDAVVHVSIVNWKKGNQKGKKKLFLQKGDSKNSPWIVEELEQINSALSFEIDVSKAKKLKTNAEKGKCFQGQTQGHEGFLIKTDEAKIIISQNKTFSDVLKPMLIGNDLLGKLNSLPSRYVIDFSPKDLLTSKSFKKLFKVVEENVLPDREKSASEEKARNKEVTNENPKANINKHHANFLANWWKLSYAREDMKKTISILKRYIVCVRVTKRPVFEFINSEINPNDSLVVFPFDDDYTFGILQSDIHWKWFLERCSTLKREPRYTSNTVFDSFPWPQNPTAKHIDKIGASAKKLRELRTTLKKKHKISLRTLYRSLENPGKHPLKDAHKELNDAVIQAYGMKKKEDPLEVLLGLNLQLAKDEKDGKDIIGPGLHPKSKGKFISKDCISIN